jgi:cell division transport system permease protein
MTADPIRILDTARGGRAMVWVLAIMLFLTVLAAALGLGTARAASALGASLAGRATVVIATADPVVRARQAHAAAAALRNLPEVTRVAPVSRADLARLLGPWLGDTGSDPDLPIPALIDIDIGDTAAATPRIERTLAQVAPGARLDRHGDALSGVTGLLRTLTFLAIGLIALMLAATGAVVMLAARAGLDAHRGTIEVMHGLGATDVQVARLFQRRLARDAIMGGVIGAFPALALVGLLGAQAGGLGSALLGSVTLGSGGWIVLTLLPFAFVALAAFVARRVIILSLARTL